VCYKIQPINLSKNGPPHAFVMGEGMVGFLLIIRRDNNRDYTWSDLLKGVSAFAGLYFYNNL